MTPSRDRISMISEMGVVAGTVISLGASDTMLVKMPC